MALYVSIKKSYEDFVLDVEFEAKNEVMALLGASGCGKSLTLKCIAGIVKPDEGVIVADGVTLFDSNHRVNLSPQERRVGLLFQNYALFPNMTVEQNIRMGLKREKSGVQRKEKLKKIMSAFRLDGLERHHPHQISGGQQQRVALARILAGEPKILMLDEPFAALDSYLKWKLEQELTDALSAFGGTTLYVSHNRGEVYRLSQSVCVMERGKSQPVLPVKALFEQPRTKSAALLSGCKNFSRARRASARSVFALDWGVTLDCEREVDESIAHIGVRAQGIKLAQSEGVNRIPCTVERTVEDVFLSTAVLRPANAPAGADDAAIRVEAEKGAYDGLQTGAAAEIFIDPGAVMPLL